MSGATDYVSDGHLTFAIANGHHYQSVITGSGCMATTCVTIQPISWLSHRQIAIAHDIRSPSIARCSAVAVFAAVSDAADPQAYVVAAAAGCVLIL